MLRDRVYGFPFIEPHENLLTADGTVYYLSIESSPKQIVADSPSAKAIVSLRDPVDRAFSHYRYTFSEGQETFAQAVNDCIPIMEACYQKHLAGIDLAQVM